MEKPIIRRFQEFSGRNRAIDDFQKAIVAGRAWFDEASRNMTEALSLGNLTRWTQEELDGVKTMLQEYESWAKDKMAAQKAVGEAMHVDPVLLNADLDSRGKALQSHVGFRFKDGMASNINTFAMLQVLGLQKKPMPKPPKTKKSATVTSTSAGAEETGKDYDKYPEEADTVRTAEDPEPTQVYAHEEL